jgi:hypothetical protein
MGKFELEALSGATAGLSSSAEFLKNVALLDKPAVAPYFKKDRALCSG